MIIALVLLSALLHATWNALLRMEADKDRTLVAAVGVATALAAAVAGARWILGVVPFTTLVSVGWAVAAGVIEWLYFASLAKALDRGSLGPVYTISRGGSIVVVWPISVALLGEALTVPAALGSAVVFAGLALSGMRTSDVRGLPRDALAWAIACAMSIAGYHLAYKAALHTGGSTSAVFALALAVASAINFGRLGADGRYVCAQLVRTRPARIVLMGIVCGGSFLILMEALASGGAGYVLTLRNTSVLFAVALSFAIGERPRRLEIIGAALVAAGAVLMSMREGIASVDQRGQLDSHPRTFGRILGDPGDPAAERERILLRGQPYEQRHGCAARLEELAADEQPARADIYDFAG